ACFFQPQRYQDPFGNSTIVTYDGKYALLVIVTTDAFGNQIVADNDFRTQQPIRITDPNGNRSEARFDALGMLIGTAVSGKATGAPEGDSFASYVSDLSPAEITAFFAAADPTDLAIAHLGTATTRLIYDLTQVPTRAATIARVTHVSDLAAGAKTKIQLQISYSDGFGRVAQATTRAAPGPLDPGDPASPVATPRWVTTGAKTYNNKGQAVRQFEPYFTAAAVFDPQKRGVSSTHFYDPVGRIITVLHPEHTIEKVVFDGWHQESWDVNDTVTLDPKTDADISGYFTRLPDADYLPSWYQARSAGGKGSAEKDAATKALAHAGTPAVLHTDTLGRPFLSIVDAGKDGAGNPQYYSTRLLLDIEGNQHRVTDALGRCAMIYDYDMLGARLHQSSMEAGERWSLNNAAGKPLRTWNSRKYVYRTEYDALCRPVRFFVQGGDAGEAAPTVFAQEILAEETVYGDSPESGLSPAQQHAANLTGKIFRHYDGAGVTTANVYDFKGNALQTTRQFAADYKQASDWSQSPALIAEDFLRGSTFDALNRVTLLTTPDQSIYRPGFDDGGLLEKIDVALRGQQAGGEPVWQPFVTGITYNARGQRTGIQYANGAVTHYAYDPVTFRLTGVTTTRPTATPGLISRLFGNASATMTSQIFKDAATVQNLLYTFDPVGNITRIEDASLQTVFYANQQIDPVCDYVYDPLYRLTSAKGREHGAQAGFSFAPGDGDYRDYPTAGASQPNDLQALRNYTEIYAYDPVGNFLTFAHQATGGNWTRSYTYNEDSQTELGRKSNRLSQTALQTSPAAPVEPYGHDAHGNMIRMPHLPLMRWNQQDQLAASSRQVTGSGTPETTYYVYDAGGQRVRKVTERQDGSPKNERLYLGGFELYREYNAAGAVTRARETLHVMDDIQRIALVETTTIGGGFLATPTPALRYQLANHLGATSLELDDGAALISYEEYGPYGGATFQAGRSAGEVSLKRYR
ncbi:MAG TPA: hypothetical protein VF920_06370, partial [Dongiaceae bacterium]